VGEAEPGKEIGTTKEPENAGRKDHWNFGGDDLDNYEGVDWSECLGSTGVPINYKLPASGTPTDEQRGMYEVSFSSRHPGGAQFVLGDGSVTFVAETVAPDVWSALGTRNGGEAVARP
jgi:prepilin-type processing-associated H-X9-DG protein